MAALDGGGKPGVRLESPRYPAPATRAAHQGNAPDGEDGRLPSRPAGGALRRSAATHCLGPGTLAPAHNPADGRADFVSGLGTVPTPPWESTSLIRSTGIT